MPSPAERRLASEPTFVEIANDGAVNHVGGLIREVPEESKVREELLESAINLIREAIRSSDPENDSPRLTRPADKQNLLPFIPSNGRETGSGSKHQDGDLTVRETEVVVLLANSKRNKEIAEILGIGVKTVETYRSRLMLKLDIHSVAQLVIYAIRRGLVKV